MWKKKKGSKLQKEMSFAQNGVEYRRSYSHSWMERLLTPLDWVGYRYVLVLSWWTFYKDCNQLCMRSVH